MHLRLNKEQFYRISDCRDLKRDDAQHSTKDFQPLQRSVMTK